MMKVKVFFLQSVSTVFARSLTSRIKCEVFYAFFGVYFGVAFLIVSHTCGDKCFQWLGLTEEVFDCCQAEKCVAV